MHMHVLHVMHLPLSCTGQLYNIQLKGFFHIYPYNNYIKDHISLVLMLVLLCKPLKVNQVPCSIPDSAALCRDPQLTFDTSTSDPSSSQVSSVGSVTMLTNSTDDRGPSSTVCSSGSGLSVCSTCMSRCGFAALFEIPACNRSGSTAPSFTVLTFCSCTTSAAAFPSVFASSLAMQEGNPNCPLSFHPQT